MAKPDHLKPLHQRKRFDVAGVSFERQTPMHEPGKYSVIDAEGGRWIVTGDGTNRYPWFIRNAKGHVEGGAKNLVDAGEWIARHRRKNPISPYKPEARA